MNNTHLRSVASLPPDLDCVVLGTTDKPEMVSGFLSETEFAYVRNKVGQGVAQFFFLKENRGLWLRFFQPAENIQIAEEEARMQAGETLRELRNHRVVRVGLADMSRKGLAYAFVEGLSLANYQFLKYHTQAAKRSSTLKEVWVGEQDIPAPALQELQTLTDIVCQARDWVNEPLRNLNAPTLAQEIEAMGRRYGFSVKTLREDELNELNMGGLLAVNQASQDPPRFCILEWNPPHARNERPVVLVGKGVVYDTGGLSIKSSEGMAYMKCDMAGGAAVAGAIAAAAANQLPVRIIGLIPITDNKVSERALAPGDVICMYSGATVEVVNTDAEGRLILADALHYAKQFDPELTLDIATLTGAAIRALGSHAICYMGSAPDSLKRALENSGWATYERLVELPLWKEYGDELRSHVADLKNMGSPMAGMISAGKFLEHFAPSGAWLHLDIAGPAYLRAASGYRPQEGTGVGVRLLYHFFKNYPVQNT